MRRLIKEDYYYLVVEVTNSSGYTKKFFSNHMKIFRSDIAVEKAPGIEGAVYAGYPDYRRYLEYGKEYAVTFKLKNRTFFPIVGGCYEITLRTFDGQEAYRKVVEHLQFSAGEEKNVTEPFVFTPPAAGDYLLAVKYRDETRPDAYCCGGGPYSYRILTDLQPDKKSYFYSDVAKLTLNIKGGGRFKARFLCAAAGIDSTEYVEIPAGQTELTKVYQVPIGIGGPFHAIMEITDEHRFDVRLQRDLCVVPVSLGMSGAFGTASARVHSPLDLAVNLKAVSGLIAPLSGSLSVSCAQMGFSETRGVAIDPTMENPFAFQAMVPVEAEAGTYRFDAVFTVDGRAMLSRSFTIAIPPAGMKLGEPAKTATAGEAVALDFTNDGGKDGTYALELTLRDGRGRNMATHAETQAIAAGGTYHVDLALPEGLKSGGYTLHQKVVETVSGKEFHLQSGIALSGLTATLNAYTLKEKYFDNEIVAGKAEIAAGGTIAGGKLKAKIVRTKKDGITVFKAEDYHDYKQAVVRSGRSFGSKTYFVTDFGLIEYDRSTGKYVELLSRDDLREIYITSTGELWVSSGWNILHRSLSGSWTTYTTADGLLSGSVYDAIEYNKDGEVEIWIATYAGISVFRDGVWSSYTTANGLPSNYVRGFAKEGDGSIWVNMYNNLYRFNGTSFEPIAMPFASSYIDDICSSANGDIWIIGRYNYYIYSSGWHYLDYIACYSQGSWTSWGLETIAPGLGLSDLAEDDGTMWFSGSIGYYEDAIVKYDGTFMVYRASEIPEIANVSGIIPVPGWEGLFFGSSYQGYIEHSAGQWQKRLIETAGFEGNPENLLLNDAHLLANNGRGDVWLASSYGLSHFKDGNFTNYFSGGEKSNITSIAVGPDGAVYAANLNGVTKIDLNGNRSSIPYPDDQIISEYEYPILALDDQGRLWLVITKCYDGCMVNIYYYNGIWNEVHDPDGDFFYVSASKIISDGSGGVWIASGSNSCSDGDGLFHVSQDLVVQKYDTSNSDLVHNTVRDICLDANGVLWILSEEYNESSDDGQAVQTLQNDLFTLQAVSDSTQTTPGYPARGIWGIAEAGDGNVVFAGGDKVEVDENYYIYASRLYWLSGQELHAGDGVFYSPSDYDYDFESAQFITGGDGFIYAIGDVEDTGEHNLLQMGAGMQKVVVWSHEYRIDAASGASIAQDLLPNRSLAAGNYVLSAELISGLDQSLASHSYGFLVRGTAVSASLVNESSVDPNVRAGAAQEIALEVLNNTAEQKPELDLKLTQVSPSGAETVLKEAPLSLGIGQSHAESFTFTESEAGVWKLVAEVSEAGTVLDSAELVMEVSEPAIVHEVIAPEFAGDEPFPVKVRLANAGKIPVKVRVAAGANDHSPDFIDEEVTLEAGEERMLTFADTIAVDRTYAVTFSGDLEVSEQKRVAFGYKGALVVNVAPQCREGSVTMGYTVASGSGLAFAETLRFGLYRVGVEAPLYAVDKSYNLYPGAEPLADALELPLAPGAYRLRWTSVRSGSGQAEFAVTPSGIGQLAFAPPAKYPIGLTDFTYTLTNTDTVAGSIDLAIEVLPAAGGAPVYTLARSHYLEAGAGVEEAFDFDFVQTGSYVVRISGSKLTAVAVPVRVLKPDEVTTSVSVEPVEGGAIPVRVNVVNSGYNDFAGTLVIEAGGLRHEEPLTVLSEATLNQVYRFDANGLAGGSQEVIAYIYDAAGNVLSQNALTVTITNAAITVSGVPQDLAIAAGSFANVTVKVKNGGNKRGEAEIELTAFDTLNERRTLTLEAGEEVELKDIYVDVDNDIPSGRYACNYTLSGAGVANGLVKGNFTFQVTGIALNVAAALDRSVYNEGETARLTLDVSSADAAATPLEAVVNWNGFNERRPFTLESGSASLAFDIPLTEASEAGGAKVFYGIYRQEGRGIYLNDMYLNFAGGVSVTLDKQVYEPGDSIHAVFAVAEAGSLTVECFGESRTLVGTGGGVDFAVPVETLGGSYGISWAFTPGDAGHEAQSGSKLFDVSGLVVKVAKAELERGKYAPGDTIRAMLSLESNRDITLALRSWTVTPESQWSYLGEQSVTVSSVQQTPVLLQHAFATTEAGTHRLVYGLYSGEKLVVSGASSFDCGDAVLIGLTSDRMEYPLGSETVKVRVEYYGQGTAALDLYVDDAVVETRSVTPAGLGATEIDLAPENVCGGRHALRAVMKRNDLTSTKRAWFTYGTELPDLTIGLAGRDVNALEYAYTVRVANEGRTASPATGVVFSDNGTEVGSASVGALEPGAYQEVRFGWNGTGKAGSHGLRFAVDAGNAIKEFAESNNVLEMSEEVPSLFYRLEIDPAVWAARRTVSIFTRLVNNQAGDLPLLLQLDLTHNASSQVILAREKSVVLTPFVQALETDVFDTGIHPAGEYTLRQRASGTGVDRTEELGVYIEPTKIISGTMTASPATIGAGVDAEVTLKLSLRNEGNVSLDEEALEVEVTDTEKQAVKAETIRVTLGLGENREIEHKMVLHVAEGVYTVTVKHLEEVVAEAEIAAVMGLEKEKEVSQRVRVLMIGGGGEDRESRRYVKAVLGAAGILCEEEDRRGDDDDDEDDDEEGVGSDVRLHGNEHTVMIVFGKMGSVESRREVKERVNRGEGLICIVENAERDGMMEEVGGVRAYNLPSVLREKEIVLATGSLGAGGEVTLKERCRLGLEVVSGDVEPAGETKVGKRAVAAYRRYGNGKAVTIAVPLKWISGGVFGQWLVEAVKALNADVFSAGELARVVPVELRVRNNTGASKTFRVEELIPENASGYGFEPRPLKGEGVRWDIELGVDEEKTVFYWLKLPDAVGTYEVKSEVYEGDQKVDEAALKVEVKEKAMDRVVRVAAEIGARGDAPAKRALGLLERMVRRGQEGVTALRLDVEDASKAAEMMAASGSAEAGAWREKLAEAMTAFARMHHDAMQNRPLFDHHDDDD